MRSAAAAGLGGAGLVLVALTFDAEILFVAGIALVILSLAAPAWILAAAARAGVSRRLHAERVLEEEPLETTLELAHGRLGLPGGEIIDPLAGGPLALAPTRMSLRPGRVKLRIVTRFERRGRRRLPAPRLYLRDPLGLAVVARRGRDEGQEVLVLPRLSAPRPLPDAAVDPLAGSDAAPSPEPPAASEVDGLRAYRPGAPASRIHWPALARGAGLLERRLLADGGSGTLVVLDTRCARSGEPVDRAVRAAASLAYELARRAGCELLLPGARRPLQIRADLSAWPAAHARLALVEGGPHVSPPTLAARTGPVLYVAAEPPPPSTLTLLERAGAAVLVLPVRQAVELGRPAAFEVAGCLGLPLGAERRRGAGTRGRRAA